MLFIIVKLQPCNSLSIIDIQNELSFSTKFFFLNGNIYRTVQIHQNSRQKTLAKTTERRDSKTKPQKPLQKTTSWKKNNKKGERATPSREAKTKTPTPRRSSGTPFSTKHVNLYIIQNFLHLKKGCFEKRENGSSFVQVVAVSNESVDVLVVTSWAIKKSWITDCKCPYQGRNILRLWSWKKVELFSLKMINLARSMLWVPFIFRYLTIVFFFNIFLDIWQCVVYIFFMVILLLAMHI